MNTQTITVVNIQTAHVLMSGCMRVSDFSYQQTGTFVGLFRVFCSQCAVLKGICLPRRGQLGLIFSVVLTQGRQAYTDPGTLRNLCHKFPSINTIMIGRHSPISAILRALPHVCCVMYQRSILCVAGSLAVILTRVVVEVLVDVRQRVHDA